MVDLSPLEVAGPSEPKQTAPVGEWDFSSADALLSLCGRYRLRDGEGSSVSVTPDPRVGSAVTFDGLRDHLIIPGAEVGELDVARSGDSVSVFALIRRDSSRTGFVAGMWQEDDRDPRRQYGLFIDLPVYGGAEQVIGHVSSDGLPSEGLPYSRDYSASARMVPLDSWRVVGFTYDGESVTSYLDGVADVRPVFRERGRPLGQELEYQKNPFHYPHGLNRGTPSDFTVGAVRLTEGLGNVYGGSIARIAVWNSALSARDVIRLAMEWTPPGQPLLQFDFYRPDRDLTPVDGGWHDAEWPLVAGGWTQRGNDNASDHRTGFVITETATGRGIARRDGANKRDAPAALAYFPLDPPLDLSEVAAVAFEWVGPDSPPVLAAVCCDDRWWIAVERAHGEGASSREHRFDATTWVPENDPTARPTAISGAAVSGIGVLDLGGPGDYLVRSLAVYR